FGQHYTRNTTYASQAIAWNTYLARCSYLLQQGSFVGDLAYFYGEGAPATVPYWKPVNPAPPEGYAHDWVNADVLLNRMSVQNGHLALPSGMSYAALVLPDYVDQVTLPVLRKLRDLIGAGAIVAAPRPTHSPSLADYAHEAEFRSIVNEVWAGVDGMGTTEQEYEIENRHTTVAIRFDPYGSIFVVFRKMTGAQSRALPHTKTTELSTIPGPWQLRFPPNWGAPPQIQLDQLISWTAYPEDGVKY